MSELITTRVSGHLKLGYQGGVSLCLLAVTSIHNISAKAAVMSNKPGTEGIIKAVQPINDGTTLISSLRQGFRSSRVPYSAIARPQ